VPPRFIPGGWKEFVLGLCAFEDSDFETAAKYFESSNQENPSIAAEAMLARTRAQLGHYDEFVNTVLRLTASPPVSSDDCLFLARAVRWTGYFGIAKAYLDRHSAGFADRPSSSILERMIRLSVDANLAQQARDCNEADRLAFEFDKIRKLVPGSLPLREETIANHVWAYRLLNRANRPSDAQEHFDSVMKIAPLVLASEQDHRGTHQLASFYEDVGQIEKATDYWLRANEIAKSRHPDRQSADFEYPYFLLRQREYDSAMEASQGEVVFILPHVMAMLGIQDADPQTYMDARWNEAPKGLTPRLMLVASLYLSGDASKAQLLAGRFLERQPEETSRLESEEVLNSVLRYYAGDEKHSTDLIALSENASDSELLAGVFVALRLIGEGDPADRAEAKRLAQKAFDNSGTYFTYTLSRTLLALLKDRNWPRVDRR
jgi:tetratricopeptide (TPR) repeat protein